MELHQGLARLSAGDHDAAASCFARAHALAPERAEVCAALGQERLRAGEPAEAEPLLRRAWSADPALVAAAADLARCLALAQDRIDEALEVLAQGRAHHGDHPVLLLAQSEILLRLGRRAEAQQAAEDALRPAQEAELVEAARAALARCHNLEGMELSAGGELERALFCFKRARHLAPGWVSPVVNMGAAFAALGRLAPARTAYEQAVTMAPDSAQAQLSLGLFLAERSDDVERGLLALQRAVALAPDSLRARGALAELFVEQGAAEEAIDLWRHAVERAPEQADAWVGLGTTYAVTGNHGRAEACLRRALELEADNVAACCGLADVLARESRYREAAVFARRACDLDPERAEALLGSSPPLRRP